MSIIGKTDAEMAKLMRRQAQEHFRTARDVNLHPNDRYAAVVMAEWAVQLQRDYAAAAAMQS